MSVGLSTEVIHGGRNSKRFALRPARGLYDYGQLDENSLAPSERLHAGQTYLLTQVTTRHPAALLKGISVVLRAARVERFRVSRAKAVRESRWAGREAGTGSNCRSAVIALGPDADI